MFFSFRFVCVLLDCRQCIPPVPGAHGGRKGTGSPGTGMAGTESQTS